MTETTPGDSTNKAVCARFDGPNGVQVEVRDETRAYGYQNVHTVKLRVEASFPSTEERFVRHLEKMGVFTEDLEQTRTELIEAFRQTGLPYLFKKGFADQLVRTQQAKPLRRAGFMGKR